MSPSIILGVEASGILPLRRGFRPWQLRLNGLPETKTCTERSGRLATDKWHLGYTRYLSTPSHGGFIPPGLAEAEVWRNEMTFTQFWQVYPKRKGANPRAPAEAKFNAAIKKGADPNHLISSAKKYAEELREQGILDTPYVCMAQTWLNQKRWLDYAPDSGEKAASIDADMAKRGYAWDGQRWLKVSESSMKTMDEAMITYHQTLDNLGKK